MNQRDDFYITLLSDASTNYYQNNSLTSFTNKLPSVINLTHGIWKVGVCEIYINDFIPNIFNEDYEESAFIIIGSTDKNILGIGKTYLPFNKSDSRCDWKAIILPKLLENISGGPGHNKKECERHLISEIYSFLTNDNNYNYKEPTKTLEIKDTKYVAVCISTSSLKLDVKIPIQRSYTVKGFLKVIFDQVKNIKSHKEKLLKDFEVFLSEFTSITKPSMINIYTDIIEPCFVGDSKVRVVKTIETKNAYDSTIIKYYSVQYHIVEKKDFDNISIKLTDKFGYDINFSRSVIPTKILLHFIKFSI